LTALLLRRVGARAVFRAAVCAQLVVLALWAWSSLAFLWYNAIGWLTVLLLATIFESVWPSKRTS
jgi:hypothetical protein